MCAVDTYEKSHLSMPDDASSGGGIPMTITSSKEASSHMVRQSTLLTIFLNDLK